jgi:N-hydroxyarylamine O-acetyltransferase
MDIQLYLDRIGYRGVLEPRVVVLRDLHKAHLETVPFENLDVLRHVPILLDPSSLFDKIVTRKRGGFCYELNGLFAVLLLRLGFHVTYLNAVGVNDQGQFLHEFDHLALRVECQDEPGSRWLVDVGWGDSFVEPLRLDERAEQIQGLRGYRIDHDQQVYYLWQHNYDGSWECQYRFDLQPRAFPLDYESMCLFHQTSPDSPFPNRRLCTLALPDGRVTLTDHHLILTRHGLRSEEEVQGEDQAREILLEKFNLVL